MAQEVRREDLDLLYSPSRWSKKLPSDVIVETHVNRTAKATLNAQSTLPCELGVEYMDSGGPTLDLYYPTDKKESADVFIYFHGGNWQQLGTEHAGSMAVPYTKQGLIVAVVGYDLAPKVNMTVIVEQCRRGCVYVAQRFSKSRVFLSGHSAGAHLAACMMATDDWSQYGIQVFPLAGAMLLSGMYDLKPVQQCYVNDALQLTDLEVELLSPVRTLDQLKKQLPAGFTKCLLANGDQESPEYKRQAEEYRKGMESLDIPCTHHEILGEDHFTIVERMEEEEYTLNKLILQVMTQS